MTTDAERQQCAVDGIRASGILREEDSRQRMVKLMVMTKVLLACPDSADISPEAFDEDTMAVILKVIGEAMCQEGEATNDGRMVAEGHLLGLGPREAKRAVLQCLRELLRPDQHAEMKQTAWEAFGIELTDEDIAEL